MIRAQLVSGLALAALVGAFNPALAQTTTSATASSKSTATAKKPLNCSNPTANTLPKGCVPVQGSTSADVNANILNNNVGATGGVTVNTPRSSANPVYTSPSTGVAAGTSGTTGSTPSTTTKPQG